MSATHTHLQCQTSSPTFYRLGIAFARGISLIPLNCLNAAALARLELDPSLQTKPVTAEQAALRLKAGSATEISAAVLLKANKTADEAADIPEGLVADAPEAPPAPEAPEVPSDEQIQAAYTDIATGLADGKTPTVAAVNAALKAQGLKATLKLAEIQAAVGAETE